MFPFHKTVSSTQIVFLSIISWVLSELNMGIINMATFFSERLIPIELRPDVDYVQATKVITLKIPSMATQIDVYFTPCRPDFGTHQFQTYNY